MRILLEDTICMAVDYQEKLMPVISGQNEVVQDSVILLKGMKALGVPVVVTTQYSKGLGATIPEIQAAADTDLYFDKRSFSAWEEDRVQEALKGKQVVLLCGTEAHVCVLQTAIDLKEHGFCPVLVTDCIGSRKMIDKEFGLERAKQEGIMLTTKEAVLFELTRSSLHPAFKIVSNLVK